MTHTANTYEINTADGLHFLDMDLAVLHRTKNLQDLLNALKSHVNKFNVDTADIAYKTKNSNFFSMLYFIIRQRRIRDWQTGIAFGNDKFNKYQLKQHDHIFLSSLLRRENYDNKLYIILLEVYAHKQISNFK